MRIFKDVQLVEHIGSGIPRILKKYDQSIFHFSPNFLRVAFPFPESIIERNEQALDKPGADKVPIGADRVPMGTDGVPITGKQHLVIIDYLRSHESVTNAIAVELLGVKAERAKVILREIADQNILEAQGEKRYRSYRLSGSDFSQAGK